MSINIITLFKHQIRFITNKFTIIIFIKTYWFAIINFKCSKIIIYRKIFLCRFFIIFVCFVLGIHFSCCWFWNTIVIFKIILNFLWLTALDLLILIDFKIFKIYWFRIIKIRSISVILIFVIRKIFHWLFFAIHGTTFNCTVIFIIFFISVRIIVWIHVWVILNAPFTIQFFSNPF